MSKRSKLANQKNNPSVIDLLEKLKKVHRSKSKAYGPQEDIIKAVLDNLLKDRELVIISGQDAWEFHLFMEIIAKLSRFCNLYLNKNMDVSESLIDSLEDGSVYSLMLASKLYRRKHD